MGASIHQTQYYFSKKDRAPDLQPTPSHAFCSNPPHNPSPSSAPLQWLKDPGPRTEKRTLCCDMVCFVFITPLAAISGWLCLRGAQDHLRLHSRLEAVGLIALTIALFTIYVLWTLVSVCAQVGGLSWDPWALSECCFHWKWSLSSPWLLLQVGSVTPVQGHPQPTVNLLLQI